MAANCNYKVKLIGALDMLRFKNMPKVREAAIQAAPATPLPKTFTTNEKAKVRHPEMQRVVVAEIRPNGPDVKTIVLKSEDGAPLAPFRAGQYVSVTAHIGETVTTRAYSLSGSPAWAKRGEYNIAVRRDPNGFVSPWVQDTWQVGQKLTISGPQGQLYYERLRDAKKVVALAGGVGITPFMAMARALRDGLEDFDLTIIYGSRTEAGIVYKKELEEVAAACDKVHVVHVLSDEEKEGYEHGFITAELIKKYGGAEYSIFMCGPQGMYNYLDTQIEPLGLRRKYVRRELFGAIKNPWDQPDYPAGIRGKTFKMKLIQCGKEYEIPVSADEPVLVAAERAGICVPERCVRLVPLAPALRQRVCPRAHRRPPPCGRCVWVHPSLRQLCHVGSRAGRAERHAPVKRAAGIPKMSSRNSRGDIFARVSSFGVSAGKEARKPLRPWAERGMI